MAIGRGGTISMMILLLLRESGTRKPTIILLLIVTAIVMGVSIMIMLVPVIRMWRIHWMVVMVRVWGRFLCAIFHVVVGQLLVVIIVFRLVALRAGLPWG